MGTYWVALSKLYVDRRSSVGSWDGSRRRMHTDLKACGQNTALVISSYVPSSMSLVLSRGGGRVLLAASLILAPSLCSHSWPLADTGRD